MTLFLRSRPRKGFTFIEVLMVVAIAGLMATFVMPRFSTVEVSTLVSLNKLLGEARAYATNGENFMLKVSNEKLELSDLSGNPILSKTKLPMGKWRIRPMRLVFFRDGSCSPGRIIFNGDKGEEIFMISVVCRAYELGQ